MTDIEMKTFDRVIEVFKNRIIVLENALTDISDLVCNHVDYDEDGLNREGRVFEICESVLPPRTPK